MDATRENPTVNNKNSAPNAEASNPLEAPPPFSITSAVTYPVQKSVDTIAGCLLEPPPEPPKPIIEEPATEVPVMNFAPAPAPLQRRGSVEGRRKSLSALPPPPLWFKPPFVPLNDEDFAKLEQTQPEMVPIYLKQKQNAFIFLTDEQVNALDEKNRDEFGKVKAEVEEVLRRKAEAEEAERREALKTPRDKDGHR